MREKSIMLMFVLLSSCTLFSQRPSIIEISSCELPCWIEIEPGITTNERLLGLVDSNPYIIQDSIIELNRPWIIFDNEVRFTLFEDWTDKNRVGVNIWLDDDKVSRLFLVGDLGINIQEIVGQFGDPGFVFASWVRSDKIEVSIVFPEEGIHLITYLENEYSELSSDVMVSSLDIFDPNIYQDLLDAGFFHGGEYDSEELNYFPWDGYGVIEEKYWPTRKD